MIIVSIAHVHADSKGFIPIEITSTSASSTPATEVDVSERCNSLKDDVMLKVKPCVGSELQSKQLLSCLSCFWSRRKKASIAPVVTFKNYHIYAQARSYHTESFDNLSKTEMLIRDSKQELAQTRFSYKSLRSFVTFDEKNVSAENFSY